jgi:phosphoribosylformylglycinamidine synthase
MRAKVYVTLKRAVLDPQGKAIARSLQHMGFSEVEDVRIGKYVELQVAAKSADDARARLDEMCKKLIANTVIEDYRIEIDAKLGAIATRIACARPSLPVLRRAMSGTRRRRCRRAIS